MKEKSNENDRAHRLYTKRKRDAAGAMRLTHLATVRFYAHYNNTALLDYCRVLKWVALFICLFIIYAV